MGSQIKIEHEDSAPQVLPLQEELKKKYGYLLGDANWGGILNIAMDLSGEKVFMDFYTEPEETK